MRHVWAQIIIFTLFYKSVHYFFENVKPAPHPQDIKRTHTHIPDERLEKWFDVTVLGFEGISMLCF